MPIAQLEPFVICLAPRDGTRDSKQLFGCHRCPLTTAASACMRMALVLTSTKPALRRWWWKPARIWSTGSRCKPINSRPAKLISATRNGRSIPVASTASVRLELAGTTSASSLTFFLRKEFGTRRNQPGMQRGWFWFTDF